MRSKQEIVGTVLLTCGVIWVTRKAIKYFFARNSEEADAKVLKALFFPDPQLACSSHFTLIHGCPHVRCGLSHDPSLSYSQFLSSLASVKYHLDVCLFVITSVPIGDLLMRLHEEGVKIRILTDQEELKQPSTLVTTFVQKGIEVRHNSSFLMHHKFAILDKKILISGSFNWTMTAANGNHENLIVTNDADLLEAFSGEFEKLWKVFNPTLAIKDARSEERRDRRLTRV